MRITRATEFLNGATTPRGSRACTLATLHAARARARVAQGAAWRTCSLHGFVRDAPARGPRSDAMRVFALGAADYPAALLDLPDPPERFYVRGTLPAQRRSVAIVGSRAATPYGLALARRLAADLAGLGLAVVSGLARGIDAAAHRGALEAGGVTVAVLPGGLDSIAPAHHADLAREIAERGALASEWESGPPLGRGVFVSRNRLIAALASAVVVVEAAERSGALSTAASARRLSRALLAFPGDVDRETSRGTHALIQGGAALCLNAGDVVRALDARAPMPMPATVPTGAVSPACGTATTRVASRNAAPPTAAAPAASASQEPSPEQRLLSVLGRSPLPLETLAGRARLAPADALAALLRMEWSGLARACPGQRWCRPPGAR